MLGGITGAISDDEAVSPAANPNGYPARTICGICIFPSPATSARVTSVPNWSGLITGAPGNFSWIAERISTRLMLSMPRSASNAISMPSMSVGYPVFSATTVMDKVMYAFLAVVILLGMWNTIAGSILTIGGEYNYREGVSVWFRSFLAFTPRPELMSEAPIGFQLHALVAFVLFALWPFTRLVHVFSAPVGYLTRPYIVYRSRDEPREGTRAPRRGWEKAARPR